VAATAARGAGAALEVAVAPFLEAAVAIAAAAAAVGAAAAAAVVPESARAGPLTALAHFLRSLAQAVLLLFSLYRLRALVRRLACCWSAVRWLPWARA
jgi:dihydrodipicolinate synthase/N-acetylneuraminate lyase